MSNNPSDWSTNPAENNELVLLPYERNGETLFHSREKSNEIYAEWAKAEETNAAAALDPKNFNLTKVQFHAILHAEGLFDPIKLAIEAMPATTAKEKLAKGKAMSDFLHANPIHRDNPLFATVGGKLGLTDEQIDNLWMIAKEL